MNMYDNVTHTAKHFDENFLSEPLLQAQWAEMIELKKIIHESVLEGGITILDIGIGDARVPRHLSGIDEIWDKIDLYL